MLLKDHEPSGTTGIHTHHYRARDRPPVLGHQLRIGVRNVVSVFDITSLLSFDPPVARCVRCRALLLAEDVRATHRVRCKVCQVTYLSSAALNEMYDSMHGNAPSRPESLGAHLAARGLGIDVGPGALEHAQRLAGLAVQLQAPNAAPRTRTLMQILLASKAFVHVITFGLDEGALTMLQMTAQQVPVSVVVSNARPALIEGLPAIRDEAPHLELVIAGRAGSTEDQPHQKLVVVDGLLAITGSVNFTTPGWRKAQIGFETIDPVTDVGEVQRRNNQLFAPIWQRFTDHVPPHAGWTYANDLEE